MSDSKIQIKVGIVEFSGEGDQAWLSSQLDKILLKIPELLKMELASPIHKPTPKKENKDSAAVTNGRQDKPKNLAIFLKDKSATTNQTKKFLVTAAYLQLNGKSRLTTSDVVAALKSSNQSRLGNPSDMLQKNVGKGFCEKDGSKDFFVTSEGFEEIGIAEE